MSNLNISSESDLIEIEIIPSHPEIDIKIEDAEKFDYENQFNLPKINGHELKGDKTGTELGLVNLENYNEYREQVNGELFQQFETLTNLNDRITQSYQELTNDIDDLSTLVGTSTQNITNLNEEIEITSSNLDALTGDVENIAGELDDKISKVEAEHLIAQIQQFKHQKVDELPEVGNESVLYLVPTEDGIYEEYIWIEDEQKYEDIGSTAIDLSGYMETSKIYDYVAEGLTNNDLTLTSTEKQNAQSFLGVTEELNKKADIVNVPVNISQLNNDSGYLTQHQSLSHLATTTSLITGLNTKANVALDNISNNIDYVNLSVKYDDGKSGYRISRNKILQQWGIGRTSTSNVGTAFNLFQPYKNQVYNIQITVKALGNYFVCANVMSNQKFMVRICDSWGTPQEVDFYWKTEGYMN